VQWEIQGYVFAGDLKVLPLKYYDIILGYDWLEAFSPMKIHWGAKWMSLPYEGTTAIMWGILFELQVGDVVQLCQLTDELLMEDAPTLQLPKDLPVDVAQLLDTYADVFTSKMVFPPPRSCNHTIPLIQGARHVNIRPYRYAPVLKNEIQKQVQEMLEARLIQHSVSPFSSPVLLVKKKDSSYQLCVDYIHLNAITIKGQYHVPIIDEFLDELKGASWFSSLDLCAGFHQIPMSTADCHKTAFQTHHGHYESRVMSFGLIGARHISQKVMNATLAPLLRKCALVFFYDILIYSQSLDEHVVHL
jgi:hypothetical protein